MDPNYSIQENFSVRYAGSKERKDQIGSLSCCSQHKECSDAKRCVSVFATNTEKNCCAVMQGLKIGSIYMNGTNQKGIVNMSSIKEFYSTLPNGVEIRYLAGKNADNKQAFAVYFKFGGQWLLLTSTVPKNKVTKSKLDAWVMKQFEKDLK